MTWLEFKRRINETTSRLTSEAVPITFLHGDREIHPDDITVCCGVAGDKLTLIIDLKEGGVKCKLTHARSAASQIALAWS